MSVTTRAASDSDLPFLCEVDKHVSHEVQADLVSLGRVMVAEEIVVTKEAVKRTERVSDTVRREEVYVDEDATLIEDAEGGPADRA